MRIAGAAEPVFDRADRAGRKAAGAHDDERGQVAGRVGELLAQGVDGGGLPADVGIRPEMRVLHDLAEADQLFGVFRGGAAGEAHATGG